MNLPKFTKKAEARAWYEKANPTHSAIWVADMMNAYARTGMYKMYEWVQRWAIDNGIKYDTAYIDGGLI
jgi:hypothetical protein